MFLYSKLMLAPMKKNSREVNQKFLGFWIKNRFPLLPFFVLSAFSHRLSSRRIPNIASWAPSSPRPARTVILESLSPKMERRGFSPKHRRSSRSRRVLTIAQAETENNTGCTCQRKKESGELLDPIERHTVRCQMCVSHHAGKWHIMEVV